MLRSLPADSPERIRLLGKFVEKDYEKIDRAVKLRRDIASRVHATDQEIAVEHSKLSIAEQEDRSDAWLSRRLDAGLYSLQTVDIILAWLVAEDAGAARKIEVLLAERDESLRDLRRTMQGERALEKCSCVGSGADVITEQLDGMDAEQGVIDVEFKDMLGALIQQLG